MDKNLPLNLINVSSELPNMSQSQCAHFQSFALPSSPSSALVEASTTAASTLSYKQMKRFVEQSEINIRLRYYNDTDTGTNNNHYQFYLFIIICCYFSSWCSPSPPLTGMPHIDTALPDFCHFREYASSVFFTFASLTLIKEFSPATSFHLLTHNYQVKSLLNNTRSEFEILPNQLPFHPPQVSRTAATSQKLRLNVLLFTRWSMLNLHFNNTVTTMFKELNKC